MSAKKKTVEPSGSKSIHVRLELSPQHRDRLRIIAAQAGMSMATYARTVLVSHIEGRDQRGN